MTSKEEFVKYLSSVNTYGRKYASSTVYTYGQSIELISSDIKYHLENSFTSLFNITDIEILSIYFDQLYSIPKVINEEKIQRNRKTNAFKRYIEFCRTIEVSNFNVNQPDLNEVYQLRTEGGRKVVISKVAERDLALRSDAIKIHGTTCFGCGFNFEKAYGSIGDGFIEIHHITPLSTYNKSKIVDASRDLMPLCSNCHRMVHRKKNYVLSLEELKKIISHNNN